MITQQQVQAEGQLQVNAEKAANDGAEDHLALGADVEQAGPEGDGDAQAETMINGVDRVSVSVNG